MSEFEKRDITCENKRTCGTHLVYTPPRNCCGGGYTPYFLYPFAYYNGCYNRCGCGYNCGGRCGVGCDFSIECEQPTVSSNKHDNTKENLLVIDGATDLLKITSGVPSSTKKSILTVYRDKTKVDLNKYDNDYKNILSKITELENKGTSSGGTSVTGNLSLTLDTRFKINTLIER